MTSRQKGWLKIGGGVLLLLAASIFVLIQAAPFRPAPPGTPNADAPPGLARLAMDPAAREKIRDQVRAEVRQEMFEKLDLTDEQKKQIEAIEADFRDKPKVSERGEMRRRIAEVLTPEQREQARPIIQGRIKERIAEAAKVLPPDQQQKLMEKLDERMQKMESREHLMHPSPDDPPPDGPPPIDF